jgi:hypothetical protein
MATVIIGMNTMPPKLLGDKLVYKLKIFMGYQRILDPKGIQTFEGNSQMKQRIL